MATLKELRDKFEKALNGRLVEGLSHLESIKITKRKITIKCNKGVASIYVTFVNKTRSYYLIVTLESKFIQEKIEEIEPPYKSNLASDEYIYSTTSIDKFQPLLPVTEKGIEKTCRIFLEKIRNEYIPNIYNIMELKIDVIGQIKKYPKYFSYPLIICLLAIKERKIDKEKIDIESLLSERTLGYLNDKNLKISFNRKLLVEYFNETSPK